MHETGATTAWIAVLDGRRGRLFELHRLPTGRIHLDGRGELAEAWDEKQHHRPSMLAGKGRSMAAFPHEGEERIRRFGKQAAAWLDEQVQARALARLSVFCAPPLLGPLRKALPPRLLPRLELRPEDLAGLGAGELAAHPAVSGTLD